MKRKQLIIIGSLVLSIVIGVFIYNRDEVRIKRELKDSLWLKIDKDLKVKDVEIKKDTLILHVYVGDPDNSVALANDTHKFLDELQDIDIPPKIDYIEIYSYNTSDRKEFSLTMEYKTFVRTNWMQKDHMDYWNPLFDFDMIDHKFY